MPSYYRVSKNEYLSLADHGKWDLWKFVDDNNVRYDSAEFKSTVHEILNTKDFRGYAMREMTLKSLQDKVDRELDK